MFARASLFKFPVIFHPDKVVVYCLEGRGTLLAGATRSARGFL